MSLIFVVSHTSLHDSSFSGPSLRDEVGVTIQECHYHRSGGDVSETSISYLVVGIDLSSTIMKGKDGGSRTLVGGKGIGIGISTSFDQSELSV